MNIKKLCKACGELKWPDAFPLDKRKADGLDVRCWTCKNSGRTTTYQVPRETVSDFLDRLVRYAERWPEDHRYVAGIVFALLTLDLMTEQEAEQFHDRAGRGRGGRDAADLD